MTRGPLPKHPEAAHAVLPAAGCKRKPPAWPLGKPGADEVRIWRDLWHRPVAAMWHAQRVPPVIVARYVTALVREADDPKAHLGSTLARLESELALTPGALARLHLTVEAPAEPRPADTPPDGIEAARRRWSERTA